MANIIKTSTDKVKSNLIGAAAGGVLVWWASKKYAGVEKTWVRAGLALVGVVLGANAQGLITAKKSVPTAKTVTKK